MHEKQKIFTIPRGADAEYFILRIKQTNRGALDKREREKDGLQRKMQSGIDKKRPIGRPDSAFGIMLLFIYALRLQSHFA